MKFCYIRCYNVVGIFKTMINFMGLLNVFDFMTFSNYFLTFFFSTRILFWNSINIMMGK